MEDDFIWVFTGVYRLLSREGRSLLWDEPGPKRSLGQSMILWVGGKISLLLASLLE